MIENGQMTLRTLLLQGKFVIPQYQRAYAWEDEPHLTNFLDDIDQHVPLFRQDRRYFLGTFLLTGDASNSGSTSENVYAIVDGQQRMTTSVILVASALRTLKAKNHASPPDLHDIFVGPRAGRRLQTISEDDGFFDEYVLGDGFPSDSAIDTPSKRRLIEARTFFDKRMDSEDPKEILTELDVLANANVLAYAVDTAAEATQIFEFQNDRGKRLTDLESLKSFLMHSLYLHGGDPRITEGYLKRVQTNFAELYRAAERIAGEPMCPDEDAVLGFHFVANEPYERIRRNDSDLEGWRHPKALVRLILETEKLRTARKPEFADRAQWTLDFTSRLRSTFQTVHKILLARDRYPDLAGLFVLERVATFWPLLLKCWTLDESEGKEGFVRTCRAMNRFAFRSAVGNGRSDMGVEELRRAANWFAGDFDGMVALLEDMSGEGRWGLANRAVQGLDTPHFYGVRAPARYLLWRYENHLRGRGGRNAQPPMPWREMIEKRGTRLQLTLDHIIPQNPSDMDEQAILARKVSWAEGEEAKTFEQHILHRLGNLVLDTRAGNASKGCRPFDTQQYAFLQSQHELRDFATGTEERPVWDEVAIKRRHVVLSDFAMTI
ncbi:DUF262 domain-containing HNH endonuclease family protein [Fulvimarina sp. MAC8]|uniref:DUF262 domain-containing protein n=1 Tax=Fulvimarina sp. MAC8 TaxID=3162874 RepID=UPI0032EE5D4B